MQRWQTTLLGVTAGVLVLGGMVACSPLGTLNALSPGKALRAQADVPYGSNARHRLDIYRPDNGNAAAPVVVFFFGGNWTTGERESYAFVGRALASRGYVVVIPDYRLYPEVRYPDFLDDSAQAVAWTAREISRYGGDPKRLFVMGHSAGAYNAAMVALAPKYLARQGMQNTALRGWIGMAGPYDFIPIENPTTRPVFHFPDTPPDSQPIKHVSKETPPALLIAANKDKLVNPQRNTGGMAARLRANGVPVQEIYYDGVSHTTLVASLAAPLRSLAPTLDAIGKFIDSDGGRQP
ncbi:MAG TPA: alpha/beta hydrolase [Telluria sp.]|jgi:acetyl esterase/lipase